MFGLFAYLFFAAAPALSLLAQIGVLVVVRWRRGIWHAPRLIVLHAAMVMLQICCIVIIDSMEAYVLFYLYGSIAALISLIVFTVSFARLLSDLLTGRFLDN